jgi:hypothetical protein
MMAGAGVPPQLLRRVFEAVDTGHHDVEDDQVRGRAPGDLDRVDAVGRCEHVEPGDR